MPAAPPSRLAVLHRLGQPPWFFAKRPDRHHVLRVEKKHGERRANRANRAAMPFHPIQSIVCAMLTQHYAHQAQDIPTC